MNELVEALVAAQKAFPTITKGRTAKVPTKAGGEYSYKYADLGDVLDAVRPVLNENGIAVVQSTEEVEHGTLLVTRLLKGADAIEGRLMLPVANNATAQQIGSAFTYARRYALCSLLGVVAEDDDDGRTASGAAKSPQRRQEPRRAAANDDGEPLATKEQTAQFTALCEAALMDRDDRKALVGMPWNQVTRDHADKLIKALVASDDLVLAKSQAGGWMAYKAGTEPFDLEPAATT